jgi:hypothetical protein
VKPYRLFGCHVEENVGLQGTAGQIIMPQRLAPHPASFIIEDPA